VAPVSSREEGRPFVSELKAGSGSAESNRERAIAKKGARITATSAAGRFLVYMPTVNHWVFRANRFRRRAMRQTHCGQRAENGVGGFIVRTGRGRRRKMNFVRYPFSEELVARDQEPRGEFQAPD